MLCIDRSVEGAPVNYVVPHSFQATTRLHDDVLMRFRTFTSVYVLFEAALVNYVVPASLQATTHYHYSW